MSDSSGEIDRGQKNKQERNVGFRIREKVWFWSRRSAKLVYLASVRWSASRRFSQLTNRKWMKWTERSQAGTSQCQSIINHSHSHTGLSVSCRKGPRLASRSKQQRSRRWQLSHRNQGWVSRGAPWPGMAGGRSIENIDSSTPYMHYYSLQKFDALLLHGKNLIDWSRIFFEWSERIKDVTTRGGRGGIPLCLTFSIRGGGIFLWFFIQNPMGRGFFLKFWIHPYPGALRKIEEKRSKNVDFPVFSASFSKIADMAWYLIQKDPKIIAYTVLFVEAS